MEPEAPRKLDRIESFDVICPADARLLILGTMPGVASLQAARYYAHPRNAFWPIMHAVFNRCPPNFAHVADWPYEDRIAQLLEHRIALWDVLAECERAGSLDSAIQGSTATANPIDSLLTQQPHIDRILFNGKMARRLFDRHLIKRLSGMQRAPSLLDLPSTSPAMASMTLQDKHRVWSEALSGATG